MVKAKVFKYIKKFEGFPKVTDFKLVEEELVSLQNGEFRAEAVYLSVDPYMRRYAASFPIGNTFIGRQIAKITETKNSNFPVGKYVVGPFGWRTHTNATDSTFMGLPTFVLPDFGDLPLSLGLGVLEMPGNTAYFGLLEICQPKEGETVVVSGAAGAVGSVAGQIAKIKGCKVIGIVGSDAKGNWLINELGFDNFINYKTGNIDEAIQKVAPQGVDCYFDNVAGQTSNAVLRNMNVNGRVALCGAISTYNEDQQGKLPVVEFPVGITGLRMERFLVARWVDRWSEGIKQNLQWIKEGKLKYHDTITEGFENTPQAFIDMLNGKNRGKAVVKI